MQTPLNRLLAAAARYLSAERGGLDAEDPEEEQKRALSRLDLAAREWVDEMDGGS